MSELRTNRIVPRDGLPSGSAGGIIQVKQTIKKDQFTTANNTNNYTDLTGLSVTITPTRSDSKILVEAHIYNSNSNAVNFFRILRGSTFIEQPSGTSSSGAGFNAHGFAYFDHSFQDTTVIKILDSPATTSATTYKVQCACTGTQLTINKFYNTSNYYGISTLTVYEVSG
tara:strand:- start:2608 stop:3117 length:510 start_codon:yes stop_codon:yes gene_type:complete